MSESDRRRKYRYTDLPTGQLRPTLMEPVGSMFYRHQMLPAASRRLPKYLSTDLKTDQ
jgi:hypothetical protein